MYSKSSRSPRETPENKYYPQLYDKAVQLNARPGPGQDIKLPSPGKDSKLLGHL